VISLGIWRDGKAVEEEGGGGAWLVMKRSESGVSRIGWGNGLVCDGEREKGVAMDLCLLGMEARKLMDLPLLGIEECMGV